jgi:hypothetical protein
MNWIRRLFTKWTSPTTMVIIKMLSIILLMVLLIRPTIQQGFDSNQPTKIADAGFGPFDYGLDPTVHASKETNDAINHLADSNSNLQSGNYYTNIFSYLGS